MKKPILFVLQGLPASGKSTWTKQKLANDNKDRMKTVCVSRDDIRESFVKNYKTFPFGNDSAEGLVTKIEHTSVIESLKAGYNVILDGTNLNMRFLKLLLIKIYREVDFEFIIESFLDVPVEDCIERDLKRGEKVGAIIIQRMAAKAAKLNMADELFKINQILNQTKKEQNEFKN